MWLVIAKKKKSISESQDHYGLKGPQEVLTFPAQSKVNAELGPGFSGLCPAGS